MSIDKSTPFALACCGMLFAGGCSTPPPQAPSETVFYPAPPAQPRIQYLTSFSKPRDLEIPASAFRIFLLGEDTTQKPEVAKPYGIAIGNRKLFICDTIAAQIHILDFETRTWEYFQPANAGKLVKPINIAVDQQGIRYVADPARGEVVVYSPNGLFEPAIGKDEGMKPVGVAVSEDRIFIADLAHHNVQVFDKASRKALFSIPKNPDNNAEKLFSPTNLTLDSDGRIYVSDTGAFHVQQYDTEGNFLRTFGEHGDSAGKFARNKGIAVDRNGNLYAVDAASQTIQIFDPEGQLLLFFGEPGASSAALTLPADVVIDYSNISFFQPYAAPDFEIEYLVFVSNQYGPRKIAVYGFGHKKTK